MIFVEEKLKKNVRIFMWSIVGLLVIEVVIGGMWMVIMDMIKSRIDYHLLVPILFTVFWSYVSGSFVRGKESSSIGLSLNRLDEAEIDVIISLLEKEKRKRMKENKGDLK